VAELVGQWLPQVR